MMLSTFGLLGTIWLSGCFAQNEKYCLSHDPNPYLYYATKTAYQFVYEKRITSHNVPNCEPVQLWLMSRHGTRYPGNDGLSILMNLTSFRDTVVYNHETRKTGGLCYEDVERLKTWRVLPRREEASELTGQGYNDMFFMAKRFKSNFPQILSASYSTDNFIVRFTGANRTHDSAKAFVDGLFGKEAMVQLPDSFRDDALLRPGNNCSAFQKVKEDAKYMEEADKFRDGPLMSNVVSTVSSRLGFLYNLTFDVILDIYSACRYDKAWNYTATSPWCAPFHKEDLKIMEYYQDLKHYYRTGYGNDLSYKVGCPIVKDLIDRFNQLAAKSDSKGRGSGSQETSTPKGVFYFVHSDTLRPVLVRLGVAKDAQPPRHDNYHQMSKRQWRTSQVSPFAGNIAAVFYKCHGNYGEENKVMFYLNEHNVDYEGCDVGLCEWSYIKKKFENVISQDSCSYKFCETSESSAPTKYTINLSLIPVVLFLLGKVL